MKAQEGGDIIVMGGGELARALIEDGVVDEIGFNIHPLLLGGGVPAFRPMNRRTELELIETRTVERRLRARALPSGPLTPRLDECHLRWRPEGRLSPPGGDSKEHPICPTPARTAAASPPATPSEVRYFGKKHGLTDDQVKDLIKQHGNDRKTLEAAVATMKGPATTG